MWRQLGRIVPSASQPSIDFPNLPSDINELWASFDVSPTSVGSNIILQFFDAAGVIVTAGYNYGNTLNYHTLAGVAPYAMGSNAIGYVGGLVLTYGTGLWTPHATGVRGRVEVHNIRDAARYKGADWQSNFLSNDGTYNGYCTGSGFRGTAGNITGLRFAWGAGGFAAGGAITLWGSP
jgi:hypothetical protein